ncbi:restriction endonuclease subunit S [Clostridium saccharobutylicum]|uniref:Type I restriction modification DNA specificity domain-containing protein n=1 Tax=Clostridium saccharobutylicum DSM 13864 TaxID=1345695 RepID=U5MMY0_CLOSA|nr:restriction endonuclease subunit S [Clostridium saccharobutylicum]AGX41915.1 hypothetical protein CLSA_c09030 [Clostridium saccharobutylicum DSM 13864]AQR89192.1 EcoKI restriction-modification system protein HsdS [Clostridium saccharobutylicum]AQR99093.1 EcoKI restriction-modification system protein HsdS [Clostridium saccharobutylicum]AQS13081.1 EcoKI restriction-modification system protein HsdS [Clostridium saccharobutylicum]MBA2907852.1 type I restriction enzyme S subunit [Clostridium sac
MNKCKLGDIAQLKTGPFETQLKASEYSLVGTPIINVKNIGYGNLILNNLDYVPESVCQRLSEHLIHEGDIVFGRKGSVDRHCLIKKQHDGWMQGSDCIRVRLHDGINPQYISYYLMLNQVKKQINDSAVGSTMASLNTDILKSVTILLPDLTIQNKIANILGTLDKKISINQLIIDKLKASSKSIYDFWFTQFDFPDENGKPYKSSGGKMVWDQELKTNIPDGWNTMALSQRFAFERGIEVGADNYSNTQYNGYVPFYRVSDLNSDCTNYTNEELLCGKILSPLDICVSFDGTVGKLDFGLSGGYSTGIRKIYDLENELNNAVIFSIFNSDYIQLIIKKYATGSNILHASASIENLYIAYNKFIYNKFQNIITPMFNKMLKVKNENKELLSLRNWLLPMLMNGQITIE